MTDPSTPLSSDIPLFEFVPGLPVEELHKELDVADAITVLGKRKKARYLFDMQERGVYAMTGHGSAVHYAVAKLGEKRRRAQECVQIGRRLDELPEIDAALVKGELSWSKMRILVRVAAPDTQAAWIERAEESNCERLSTDVARCLPGDPPRKRGGGGLTDIRMTVRGSLQMSNHQMWEQAKRKLSMEGSMRVTNEDMMIHAARLILSTDADGKAEGRTKVKHSPFQLIVHQEQHDGFVRTRVHTDHGDVELPADQAERVAAEAEVVPAAAPVADPHGKTPTRLVRRVLARDNQRCQNCGNPLHIQVHHVEFRSLGGRTEENLLASVCGLCHAMIHSGLLSLHGDASSGFVFLDRSGGAVESRSAPLPVEALRHAAITRTPKTFAEGMISIWQRVGSRRELAPSLRIPMLASRTAADAPARACARPR